jgi:hypothetical protein
MTSTQTYHCVALYDRVSRAWTAHAGDWAHGVKLGEGETIEEAFDDLAWSAQHYGRHAHPDRSMPAPSAAEIAYKKSEFLDEEDVADVKVYGTITVTDTDADIAEHTTRRWCVGVVDAGVVRFMMVRTHYDGYEPAELLPTYYDDSASAHAMLVAGSCLRVTATTTEEPDGSPVPSRPYTTFREFALWVLTNDAGVRTVAVWNGVHWECFGPSVPKPSRDLYHVMCAEQKRLAPDLVPDCVIPTGTVVTVKMKGFSPNEHHHDLAPSHCNGISVVNVTPPVPIANAFAQFVKTYRNFHRDESTDVITPTFDGYLLRVVLDPVS